MKKIHIPILCGCLLLLFVACQQKELPAPAYDRGDVHEVQIELSPNYKTQVWFCLSENKIISTNSKTDWDLAFDCSPNGTAIYLNTAKVMRASKTNAQQMNQVNDTSGFAQNALADMPNGHTDSTAIGNWQSNNTVYVINRGYDENSLQIGYYKLKILSVNSQQFVFEYGDIYSTTVWQGTVNKDPNYRRVMYSFSAHQQVNIEPKKTDYDLCFTQYTHYFHNPPQLYQVCGILNNMHSTRIATLSGKTFAAIVAADTSGLAFSAAANCIGYDWKNFDLNTNLYTVDANKNYIIQDSKGFYYKLHFTDFYNESGIKGYPKFEFKKL